jgi:ribosomal-protein-alanine N-acetyltransferase
LEELFLENILTERCLLTPLNEKDFNGLIPLYTSEKVRKYLGGIRSNEKALECLQESIASDEYNFTVKLNETGEVIGILMIAPHHDTNDKEISYMFLPDYWGNGYAKETLSALLNFCKKQLKLKRIVSETQAENKSSCRLLEQLGYEVETELERFGANQIIYFYQFDICGG